MSLKLYRISELILNAIFLIVGAMIFNRLEIIISLVLLLVFQLILCLLSFLERFIYKIQFKTLHYVNFSLLIFDIIITISNILTNQDLKTNGYFIYILLIFHGINNLIILIKNNDKLLTEKTLPLGIYNDKQNKRNNMIATIPAIIGLLAVCLLSLVFNYLDVILYVMIIDILLTIILTAISNKKETNKLITFENDLDYQKMEKQYQELLSNNLHEETKNYLYSILYIYESLFDKEKGQEIYSKLNKPTNNIYLLQYYRIYLYNIKDNETWEKEFNLIKYEKAFKNKIYQNYLNNLKAQHDSLYKGKLSSPIDVLFPINNSKTKLDKALNLYFITQYYKKINDEINYNKYKELFLKDYSGLTTLKESI